MKLLSRREVCNSPTWIEINKSALLNNISQIKKYLKPKTKFMAVVKSNAYGHGLLEVAEVIENKIDYFAVFAFADALLLRKKNVKKPILALSSIDPKEINLAIKHDIEIAVSNFDLLSKVKKNLKIHICVDTGLGRDGFVSDELEKVVSLIREKSANVVGLYGHFAAADDKKFDSHSKKQIEELLFWKRNFSNYGIKPNLIHHSASAGVLYDKNHPEFNLVRIGIALYGLWPSSQKNKSIELKPVLSWKARISEIKSLPKGRTISYGCTHILDRDSVLALIPIGYFDGISRLASNKALVTLNGKKIHQLGRVTMNLLVLDITDLKGVKVGDVVTIIGDQISADDWANWSETSNYEVVTKINPAITRVLS